MARIKGSQMLGVVKALRQGVAAHKAPVPPHLQSYFEDRLITGAWYPEDHFRDLVLLLGNNLAPHIDGNPWHFIGRSGAERDFQGIYAALVRRGAPKWTVDRLPEGWKLYRDSGLLSVSHTGDGQAQVVLRAYAAMCPELAAVNSGYFEGALAASEAEAPEASILEVGDDTARWLLRW